MDEQEESEPTRAPRYEWASGPDEERRAFIIEQFANSDIDANLLIANMERVFQWLKHGTVSKPAKRKLAVVQPSEVE